MNATSFENITFNEDIVMYYGDRKYLLWGSVTEANTVNFVRLMPNGAFLLLGFWRPKSQLSLTQQKMKTEKNTYVVKWSKLYKAYAIYEIASNKMLHGYDHPEKSVVQKECDKLNAESEADKDSEKQKLEDEIIAELKEAKHWFGSWDELRKVIDNLENNDKEAAYERAYRI